MPLENLRKQFLSRLLWNFSHRERRVRRFILSELGEAKMVKITC